MECGGSSAPALVFGHASLWRLVAPSWRPLGALRSASPAGNGATPPLRAKMLHDMPWPRLAPKPQQASGAAGAGLAQCSQGSPDRLHPEQMRTYLHPRLVERRRAWRSCHQAAARLQFFSPQTLGWAVLHLALPPRPGRSPLPRVLRSEALQRVCTNAKHPRHRVLLMPPYAAGLRVSAVVRLTRTALARDRRLIRVEPGQGRQDRSTRLAPRLLTALRAYWQRYRPAPWLCTGRAPPGRCPSARRSTSPLTRSGPRGARMARASLRGAMVAPPGSQPGATSGRSSCCWALRHATPPRGPSGSPGSRWRHSAARATSCPAGPPLPTPESRHATAGHRRPSRPRGGPVPPPTVGRRRLSSASLARHTAVPILGPPRLSRCGVTAKPAVPRHSAGTPHGVRPVGVSDTRLTPAASATAPRASRGRRSRGARPAKLRGCLGPLATWG